MILQYRNTRGVVLFHHLTMSLRVSVCRVSLTFVVEVVDVLRAGGGYKLSRRPFRPTNNAVPFW